MRRTSFVAYCGRHDMFKIFNIVIGLRILSTVIIRFLHYHTTLLLARGCVYIRI